MARRRAWLCSDLTHTDWRVQISAGPKHFDGRRMVCARRLVSSTPLMGAFQLVGARQRLTQPTAIARVRRLPECGLCVPRREQRALAIRRHA